MTRKPPITNLPSTSVSRHFGNGVRLTAHTYPGVNRNRAGGIKSLDGRILTRITLEGLPHVLIALLGEADPDLHQEDWEIFEEARPALGLARGIHDYPLIQFLQDINLSRRELLAELNQGE